jgi:prepilin-type processing-associated H-X9-DG protein
LFRNGKLVSNDLTVARVNAGGWARPASDFSVDGADLTGAIIPGPKAINATNGDIALTYPLPPYGTEGTGEAYSFHTGGANFAFGDGSVHFLPDTINIREFARLVSRADGLANPVVDSD